MKIDPLLEPILRSYSPVPSGDVVQRRAQDRKTARAMVGTLTRAVPESVCITETVTDMDPPVPVRVFTPHGTGARAALVFAHGGGWATGSPEDANEHCGWLAHDADVVVVSVGYRLIPEHPFPAGLDDYYHAVEWTVRNAESLGIDAGRIAVGGESAGGNLAAAAALRARDQNGPAIAFQLLEVPALDLTLTGSPSFAEVREEFPDFATGLSELVDRYLSSPDADPHNPYVSPLAAPDVGGLPPALLLACEIDPVRDDSARYAKRLNDAGVHAETYVFAGLVHGTQSFAGLLPSARHWQDKCVKALRAISAGQATPHPRWVRV